MDKQTRPRRILACVTGLTPQVVTETVYALSQCPDAWVPHEVHVLTTLTGEQHVRNKLLDVGEGRFRALCQQYGLEDIRFDASHVHVLRDRQDQPMDDIRCQEDNLAMADAILAFIASASSDPDSELHVSLAGGRKSMGFFAGYALSLYGRPQDRLSHVLVSKDFETLPSFFFPPIEPVELETRDGRRVSTATARIDLADIPFVRLRDRLPRELLDGGRFVDAVEAAQRFEQPPQLVVDCRHRAITCAGTVINMSTLNFAVYAWLADRAKHLDDPAVRLPEFNAVHSGVRQELASFGRKLYANPVSREAEEWEARAWDDDRADHNQWLSERRSRINRTIRDALGRDGKKIYGIASVRTGGRKTQHQLALSAPAITFHS